ncbi:MAG: hypothetical protein Q9197_006056 [Variospora fuerteventurae]
MHDPLTSTLCPHSFERTAILGMLDASPTRTPTGEKAMKCPECEVLLTAGQLAPDAVLVRKIRRIEAQERREREDEGSDGDDDDGEGEIRGPKSRARARAEDVGSSPARERGVGDVKRERMSGRERGHGEEEGSRETSMVPATQIVDFGEGDGETE